MKKKFLILNLIIINFINAGEIHKIYLGESSKVVEKDLLETIQEHINDNKEPIEKRLREIEKKAKDEADNYKNKYTLPFATKDETKKSDLHYVVTDKDIAPKIPVGSIVYPLKYTKLPYTIYIINGEDESELEWIKKQNYKSIKSRVWIVNGSLKKMNKQLQVPVYFYSEKIQERFKVKGTPAKIYQTGEEMIFQYYKLER